MKQKKVDQERKQFRGYRIIKETTRTTYKDLSTSCKIAFIGGWLSVVSFIIGVLMAVVGVE